MRVVTADFVRDKKVLLRLDLDVPIENGKVKEDYRLEAGMDTLDLCLQHAKEVIVMGHVGRPEGEDESLSVKPIVDWLEEGFGHINLPEGKLHILENLRFEKGEDEADEAFAKELASLGEVYVNDAFAAHHKSASTTVLPTLLPSAAGLHFAKEVETLTELRKSPQRPLVAIIGGIKLEDKLPAVKALAQIADWVLVGGKLVSEIEKNAAGYTDLGANVLVADLTEDGEDITTESVEKWKDHIFSGKEILWNGPLGKVEDPKNEATKKVVELILQSGAKTVVGGGDSVTAVDSWGLGDKFDFVSTGGGAMLEFIIKGTLPTIEVLSDG